MGVKPLNGTKNDIFEYLIEYSDVDGDKPIKADGGYVKISINGKKYYMVETNKDDNDVTDGKYYNFSIAAKLLNPGINNFQIYVHDGTYLTKSSKEQGPDVEFGTPPVANAGNDRTVKVGELFELDASSSYDADGSIEKYLWDTDNDGDFNDSGGSLEGVVKSWKFDLDGVYVIALLVIDNDGNPARDTVTITVKAEDSNGQDGDGDWLTENMGIVLAVIILLIVILLLIVFLVYRKKTQEDRERKAFMIDEKEGEEEEESEEEDEDDEGKEESEDEEEEEEEDDEGEKESEEEEEDIETDEEEIAKDVIDEDELDEEFEEEFEEDFEEDIDEEFVAESQIELVSDKEVPKDEVKADHEVPELKKEDVKSKADTKDDLKSKPAKPNKAKGEKEIKSEQMSGDGKVTEKKVIKKKRGLKVKKVKGPK